MIASVLSEELTDEISAEKTSEHQLLMRKDFASELNSNTIKIRNTIVDKFFNHFRLMSCLIVFSLFFFIVRFYCFVARLYSNF
jgi:hypothetical protein